MKIDINEATLTAALAETLAKEQKLGPWKIGQSYLIRTLTYASVGRLTAVYDRELVLEDGSWVADTGRFHSVIQSGKWDDKSEVEPVLGPIIVARCNIIDAFNWQGELPTEPV